MHWSFGSSTSIFFWMGCSTGSGFRFKPSIKQYSTSSALQCSQQPRYQHKHHHRHPWHQQQLRRYHKPFQQKQRKRLYQYQQAPSVPLISSTNRTNEAMATMEATESTLRTPLWVTGRTARTTSSGHIFNLAQEIISMIKYTLLSLVLAICIATACICIE